MTFNTFYTEVIARLTPFQVARLKLTGWYLLFLSFFLVFFTYLTLNAKQSTYIRVTGALEELPPEAVSLKRFQEQYEVFNQKFRERLLFFDSVLFLISGGLSYFLSGKTLQPIKRMLEDQEAFAGDVSHGLRTPLATMKLEIEAATRTHKQMPDGIKEVFVSMMEEVVHMTHIVEGLLALVRSQKQLDAVNYQTIALNQMMERLVDRMQSMAEGKNQHIVLRHLQPVDVYGDRHQLSQVFSILLDNSLKYSGSGKTTYIDIKPQKSLAEIVIADEGGGIPDEDLPHIFKRFYRSQTKEKQKIKGTGLGLAIAYKMVNNHNGTIHVRNLPKGGAEFRVTLPRG